MLFSPYTQRLLCFAVRRTQFLSPYCTISNTEGDYQGSHSLSVNSINRLDFGCYFQFMFVTRRRGSSGDPVDFILGRLHYLLHTGESTIIYVSKARTTCHHRMLRSFLIYAFIIKECCWTYFGFLRHGFGILSQQEWISLLKHGFS